MIVKFIYITSLEFIRSKIYRVVILANETINIDRRRTTVGKIVPSVYNAVIAYASGRIRKEDTHFGDIICIMAGFNKVLDNSFLKITGVK